MDPGATTPTTRDENASTRGTGMTELARTPRFVISRLGGFDIKMEPVPPRKVPPVSKATLAALNGAAYRRAALLGRATSLNPRDDATVLAETSEWQKWGSAGLKPGRGRELEPLRPSPRSGREGGAGDSEEEDGATGREGEEARPAPAPKHEPATGSRLEELLEMYRK